MKTQSRVPFIIIGIIAIIGGILTMVFPLDALNVIVWIIAFCLLVSGICLIVTNAKGNSDVQKKRLGTAGLVMGILLAILGLLAVILPGIRSILVIILLVLFAISLVCRGIDLLIAGCRGLSASPVLSIILGIILILGGINAIAYIFIAAVTLGIFLGCGLIVFGISLLFSSPLGTSKQQA